MTDRDRDTDGHAGQPTIDTIGDTITNNIGVSGSGGATELAEAAAGVVCQARRMSRVRGLRALAVVLVVPALVAALAGCTGTTPAPAPPAALTAAVKSPVGLAVAGNALWAVSSADGTVVRIDPATGAAGAGVPVGKTPLRAAAAGDLLWVTVFGSGHVVAVDTTSATVVHDVELGGGPEGIAVGFDTVWVVRQDARVLTQLDRTGAKIGDVPVGTMPRLLAIGAAHVWVSDFGAGTLTRVDPAAGTAQTSAVLCPGAQGLAVNAGVVWLTCTTSNEVLAVDEQTMAVRGRVAVPGEPDAIRVVDDRVWVAATDGPTLVELSLDPDAPAILSQRRLADDAPLRDRANVDLAALDGRLWVSALRSNTIYSV
jgi:streptogramin lyase